MPQNDALPPNDPISEAKRERETFRYDHQLDPSNYLYVKDGKLPHDSKLFTATDSVLTGLAQLGTFQTDTTQAFISLFDATHQYVVAEASSSTRIAPGIPSEDLALCGVAIPRSQGTCDHVLTLAQTSSHLTAKHELPVSIVPNLADDARFACRPYCQFPGGRRFYAGVPIRTRKGINIGSYCVMSPAAPPGWNSEHTQCLRDISRAITGHLEFRKSSFENQRHERFTTGLSAFIEGRVVVHDTLPTIQSHEYQAPSTPEDLVEPRNDSFLDIATPTQTTGSVWTVDTTQKPPLLEGVETSPSISGLPSPGLPHIPLTSPSIPDQRGPSQIFYDAAHVIQNTFHAAGCVFLDTTPLLYDRQLDQSSNTINLSRENSNPEVVYPTSSSDEYFGTSHKESKDGVCDILGVSAATSTGCSSYSHQLRRDKFGCLPRLFLAKLLKLYPKGKIFNFDASGELQSNDSSEDSANVPVTGAVPTGTSAGSYDRRKSRLFRHREHINIMQEAFPGARSIMFVPVWDPKRERWLASGFVVSTAATRFYSVHEDLSLVVAFSKIVSAEILRNEVLQTEKAKSDALGSISHELRSPLHGIILSTEVLNDTDLTVYQGNSTHIIETCCRTLLDTINHLLDFSKVNNVTQKSNSQQSTPTSTARSGSKTSFFGKQYNRRLTRLDGLVEDVVVSVAAGFNFERMSPEQFGPSSHSRGSISKESLSSTFDQHEDWPGKPELMPEGRGAVAVYVTTDPTSNWLLDLQPGPLRRIVMNLVGNSLKHTSNGTIHVKLAQESSKRANTHKVIRLTVSDTGSGISDDFQRHSLFQPFSQEDALSPGIGLGLSLVKRMVTQMRGRIKIQSQLGVGTTVQVTLPHSQPLQPTTEQTSVFSDEDLLFEKEVKEISGLRLAIRGFRSTWGNDGRSLVETICCRWLNLSLVTSEPGQPHPDLLLSSEDAFIDSDMSSNATRTSTPIIVVCRDAASAWRLYKAYETIAAQQVIEFVSQPIAPRLFAKAILHAYQRWTGLPNLVLVPRPTILKRAHSVDSGQPTPLINPLLESFLDGIVSEPARMDSEALEKLVPQQSTTEVEAPEILLEDTKSGHNSVSIKKLLLVDDNNINLKVLSAIVTKLGHSYQIASNGLEAVNAYKDDPTQFCGILMDISMPVMDGLEATRRIREHERKQVLPMAPILALTGLSSDDTHREALESGVNVFLTKPVKFPTLREALISVSLSVTE